MSRLYCDTCFLIPLLIDEASSAAVRSFMAQHLDDELIASDWTRVEVSSMLGQQVRERMLNEDAAMRAEAQFAGIMLLSFSVITPSSADFTMAQTFLRHYGSGLRSGDALHLAIAHHHGADRLLTFDKKFIKASQTMGLSIADSIPL